MQLAAISGSTTPATTTAPTDTAWRASSVSPAGSTCVEYDDGDDRCEEWTSVATRAPTDSAGPSGSVGETPPCVDFDDGDDQVTATRCSTQRALRLHDQQFKDFIELIEPLRGKSLLRHVCFQSIGRVRELNASFMMSNSVQYMYEQTLVESVLTQRARSRYWCRWRGWVD